MKSTSQAPKPDPKIGEAALMQAKTGEDWLNFAKDSFAVSNDRQADLDALTKQVSEQQLGVAQDQAAWARADRQRYEDTFKPVEDEYVQEATNYATPERQAAAAASAKADVANAAVASKQQAERNAAGLGISPTSGRYAGIERAGDLGTALGEANAANNARTAVQDKGLALKADVVNLGRGLPSQSAQAAALGLNAGSSAVGLNQSTNAQYLASTDIMGSGYKGAMAGYGGEASTLNQQYSNQIQAWQAQQNVNAANSQGFGQFLGTALGFAFSSDKNVKRNKKKIKEGAGLDAVRKMPVEEWDYKPGAGDGGRHVGPYAQDFKNATGRGDGKSIAVQDAIGITMKAVQDLDSKVDKIAAAVGLGRAAAKKPTRKAAVEPMEIAA
jgi:hypothetical protein